MAEGFQTFKGEMDKVQIVAEDEDDERFEPLEDHYDRDVGFFDDNNPGESLFKEGRAKDVPCQFHSGFSGTCWKGSNCPYSHDKYTGGYFARDYPELALAASAGREATCVIRLAEKSNLGQETEFLCRVTHVVDPSEFFVVPIDQEECLCAKVEEKFKEIQVMDEKEENCSKPQSNDQLEAYTYGFNCMEIPNGISAQDHQPDKTPVPKNQPGQLHAYLQSGQRYRKYQSDHYFPLAELVAAKVRKEWMRAVVLFCDQQDITKFGTSQVLVQLLDTGEKLTLSSKDLCRLPEKFCNTPSAAFRCCIFGASPVYRTWTKSAIQAFKELVENKVLLLIVKEPASKTDEVTSLLENRQYVVKLVVFINKKYTDIAQVLIKKGFGFKWNPFPYRPFSKDFINPFLLDCIYQPWGRLPDDAVKTENDRLEYLDMYTYNYLDKPKDLSD